MALWPRLTVMSVLCMFFPLMGKGKVCDLTSTRFPEMVGEWHHTERPFSPLGYDELSCPDIVHLTDCLRRASNTTRTAQAYSMRFLPQACELSDFTPQDAAKCLGASRKLIYIGDSMTYSQFESMACFLGPVTQQIIGSQIFTASNFANFTQSKYAADLYLESGSSIHMRGVQPYSSGLWKAALSTMPELTSEDIVVVNEGAHHIYNGADAYKASIAELILDQLRPMRATIYWREYAPAHFGGPSGAFAKNMGLQKCEHASIGEHEWNDYVKEILMACGDECNHIKWLPIFSMSLPRHSMHTGDHMDESARGGWAMSFLDCRHFCLPILDYWNIILLQSMCLPEGRPSV